MGVPPCIIQSSWMIQVAAEFGRRPPAMDFPIFFWGGPKKKIDLKTNGNFKGSQAFCEQNIVEPVFGRQSGTSHGTYQETIMRARLTQEGLPQIQVVLEPHLIIELFTINPAFRQIPSGNSTQLLKIVIYRYLQWIYPLKMVIFHSYVNVYQRVNQQKPILWWAQVSVQDLGRRWANTQSCDTNQLDPKG